jgi:cytochrome P450
MLVPMSADFPQPPTVVAATDDHVLLSDAFAHDPAPCAPRFDAWMISRYDDVQQALHDPCLVVVGAPDQPHREVRHAVKHELASVFAEQWRAAFRTAAREQLYALPESGTVELMHDFAAPWARRVCSLVLQLSADEVDELVPLARTVFLDAAHSIGGAASATAQASAVQLARRLSGRVSRGVGAVQTFVALSQTVPALITGSLLVLLEHPVELAWLRTNGSAALPASAESELLRLASPSRALFREVRQHTRVGDVQLTAGSRAMLMTGAANRDADRFPQPHRLDLRRTPTANLALGSGAHGCAGAVLVRMLLAEGVRAVIEVSASLSHVPRDVQWLNGVAMRAPHLLPVTWQRA